MSRLPLDQGPSTEQPSKTAGGEGTAAKVDAMRKLEDLGHLFAPETCGHEPQRKLPCGSQ